MNTGKPIRPADASNVFQGSCEMIEHRLPVQPKARKVGTKMMCAELVGLNRLAFFWGGEDRTKLLAGLCKRVWDFDKRNPVRIDGGFVTPTEDDVGIYLVLRRCGPDPREDQSQLRKLAENLKQFASETFQGEQIPVRGVIEMGVAAPDKPGTLFRVAEVIADLGLNIKKLETETANISAGCDTEPEPRCLLMFRLELPRDDSALIEDLKGQITGLELGIQVGFGVEAKRMWYQAFIRPRPGPGPFAGGDSDNPFTLEQGGSESG
jgi:hypothetical protein